MQIKDALLRAQEAAAPEVGSGRLAEHIPSLASVDPHQFGMAVASCDGEVHAVGDVDAPFSVQSIMSKVFTLALVIAAERASAIKDASKARSCASSARASCSVDGTPPSPPPKCLGILGCSSRVP